jgi:integrase-like protein
MRALRRLQREQGVSSHVFMTERDGPMTPKAFHALFGRIGARAKMQFPIHPHMLRHGCGYALANAGHDTHGRYRLGSGTETFSTRCVTPSWHRIGSRTSGADRSASIMTPGRRGTKWCHRDSHETWAIPLPLL